MTMRLSHFLYCSARSSLKSYYYFTRLKSLSYSPTYQYTKDVAPRSRRREPRSGPPIDVNGLYRRVFPEGVSNVSVLPILDNWVRHGNPINKPAVRTIIYRLRNSKRYTHAIEVSAWMTDRLGYRISPNELALRLSLISKAKGIDEAVAYFDHIPEQLKCLEVYSSLLRCYAEEISVEKAEEIMQKMRDLGFIECTMPYDIMIKLYCKTNNYDKLKILFHEMKSKGIVWTRHTYNVLLASYSACVEDIDVIVQKMESELEDRSDWNPYASAAGAYMKLGCVDKASMMLKKCEGLIQTSLFKKCEGLIQTSQGENVGYDFFITQYAAMGNKAEVLRLWEVYKEYGKIYNYSYKFMITSLIKLDDITGAENVLKEWEHSELTHDFRIPNILVDYYCKKGLMGNAEALVERAMQMGKKPSPSTWYYFATGYVLCGQPQKAVEAVKRAISECLPRWQLPSKNILITCLKYMKGNNDVKEAKKIISSLAAKDIVPADIEKELLNYLETDKEDISCFMEGDSDIQDKVPETEELQQFNPVRISELLK